MAENELAVNEHAAALGRRGGKARLVKMTAEERTRVAKLAAQARWAKRADAPDPNDPKGPKGDPHVEGTGIMLSAPRRGPTRCRPSLSSPRKAVSSATWGLFDEGGLRAA